MPPFIALDFASGILGERNLAFPGLTVFAGDPLFDVTGNNSLEQRITAAYAYAALNGKKWVFLTASMAGFNPNLVTPAAGVQLLVEGRPAITGQVALVSGVTPSIDVSLGDYFTVNILTNIAVVIAVPTNNPLGSSQSQRITIAFRNSSGGALTTQPTFNTGAGGFKFNAVTAIPNGKQVLYEFQWDPIQAFWYQVGSPGPAL